MAKGGGIKSSKGGSGGVSAAPAVSAKVSSVPTESSVLSALDAAISANGSSIGRALIADVRDRMGGTRAEQDAALLKAFDSGKVELMKNDYTKSVTERERDAGIQFGDAGVALPRTIIYRRR